jgi:hypothetical protein
MKTFYYLSIFIFLSITACKNSSDSENSSDSSVQSVERSDEDKALDAVIKLQEFKDVNEQIKAITNGKQEATFIINAPSEDHSEYYIQVGYNQEQWFENMYIFIVDPKTFDVSIEDLIEGDVVPIETWRQREERR